MPYFSAKKILPPLKHRPSYGLAQGVLIICTLMLHLALMFFSDLKGAFNLMRMAQNFAQKKNKHVFYFDTASLVETLGSLLSIARL